VSGPVLIVLAAVLWATTGIAAQLAPAMSTPTIGALRLVPGAALLAAVCTILRRERVS
jgi:drug/metabolite transporter (DMT)-like permease